MSIIKLQVYIVNYSSNNDDVTASCSNGNLLDTDEV